MDDRQLLEGAARAMGAEVIGEPGCYFRCLDNTCVTGWNPLADDGDALRLAVKLNLTVRCYMGGTCAQATTPGGPSAYVEETNLIDPLAATRRAIVQAAAHMAREGG